jgi:ABC-2 type transport system permease protein
VLSEVEQIADMVGIVRNGALVVVEQVATLKARAVRRLDLTFADAPPVDALRAQRGVRDLRADGRRVHAVVEGSLQGLMRVAGVAGLDNVVTHEADLEQIFLDYYQTGVRARANAPAGGEEEAGTLEVLLSTPIPRARVLIEKALALLAGVAILAVVLFATMVAFGPFVDLGLGLGYAAAAATSMALLGAEFGVLALAVGAVTGRRGLAAAVAGVAAVVSYLLFALGGLVDEIEPWRFLSPFQHAMGSDPILGGLSGGYVVAMVAVSLAVTVLAAPLLERRDIAV